MQSSRIKWPLAVLALALWTVTGCTATSPGSSLRTGQAGAVQNFMHLEPVKLAVSQIALPSADPDELSVTLRRWARNRLIADGGGAEAALRVVESRLVGRAEEGRSGIRSGAYYQYRGTLKVELVISDYSSGIMPPHLDYTRRNQPIVITVSAEANRSLRMDGTPSLVERDQARLRLIEQMILDLDDALIRELRRAAPQYVRTGLPSNLRAAAE